MVRGRGGVGCPDHWGGAGPGHMFIVRGGAGSPMIRSQSASLPSLVSVLHLIQETPLKRTYKYFEVFRVMSNLFLLLFFLRINFYVNVF